MVTFLVELLFGPGMGLLLLLNGPGLMGVLK